MLVRLCLWIALALGLLQAAFFVGAAILPFETVGQPALDRPFIRAQMWGASGQPLVFVGFALTTFLAAILGPAPKRVGYMTLAVALMLVAHVGLLSETRLLIRGDELVMPTDGANRLLLITRIGTATLAVLAAVMVAWNSLRQLLRDS